MPNSFDTGLEIFNANNHVAAKGFFLQALTENPEIAESHFYLGQCYFLSGEPQQAIDSLKRFIELRQFSQNLEHQANLAYAFDTLGQCYEAQSKDTAALTCYQTATKIHPACASAWHNMGLLYLKAAEHYLKTNLEGSIKCFEGAKLFIINALKLCSENPSFLHSVASWYEQYIEVLKKVTTDKKMVQENIVSNFKHAIHYYQKALAACEETNAQLKNTISLNLAECLAQYGHYLYKKENYKDAQQVYSDAILHNPLHCTAISQMGMALSRQSCFSDARKSFASILDIAEDKQELADAWLNIACTYTKESEWVKAQDALNQAKTLAPEDPEIVGVEMELMEAMNKGNVEMNEGNVEIKLAEEKLTTMSLSTSQAFFGNSNIASKETECTLEEESSFQLK